MVEITDTETGITYRAPEAGEPVFIMDLHITHIVGPATVLEVEYDLPLSGGTPDNKRFSIYPTDNYFNYDEIFFDVRESGKAWTTIDDAEILWWI